jgi:hypothetical protein
MGLSVEVGGDSVGKQQANFLAYSAVAIDRANGAIDWGWRATTQPFFLKNIGVGNWGLVNQTTSAYAVCVVQGTNVSYFSGMAGTGTDKYKVKLNGSSLSDFNIG